MACPWAKISHVEPVSFAEITSEEIAKHLQEKEYEKLKKPIRHEIPVEIPDEPIFETETDSDEVIAYMLQAQYNQEHDKQIDLTEKKFNRDSKVSITYSKYRTSPRLHDEVEPVADDEQKDFDRFVSVEKEYASMPRCGYKKVGEGEVSQIVTKHDIQMCSRINACRVLEFPPGIETGDTGGSDIKLDNKVFNTLRNHSKAHCSREKAKARPQTK